MPGGTLHQLFEERARREPDRTAVVTEVARITYRELDTAANRLAGHLTKTVRLPAGGKVAVCTGRFPDALVAVLAVLKAGGAYALVPPDGPAHRIGRLLDLTGAQVVVTHSGPLPRVDDGSGRRIVCLDDADEAAAIAARSGKAPGGAGISVRQAAAVLLTAGTTGARRAVTASHARLTAAHRAWSEVYRLTGKDVALTTAAPGSTEFNGAWIRALCSGATLVLPRRLAAAEGVTVVDTDPVAAAELPVRDLPSLRLVAVGGERFRFSEHAALHRRLAPGARVLTVYGTAEVAGCGTWFETGQLPGPIGDPERYCYLGRPFPGCAATVRRGQIWLTPPGGGDAVPTGDLGHADGEWPLEFRGRMAHRVKVEGRTVDTYRVEAALAGHPAVREAVVTSVPSGHRGGLVAYVVPAVAGAAPGMAALRDHLDGAVPARDVPTTVVPVRSLPRNEAGKVDREALPKPPNPKPLNPAAARSSGKGGAGTADMAWLAAFVLLLMPFLTAVLFTDVFWPGSTDLTGVPDPWAGLFRGLYFAEWLAFTAGMTFLVIGWPMMARLGRPRWLTTAAHLAIVWLLVSWWPQDNFYRLAAKDDWPRQAALVYIFNVPLMIAAAVVAVWAAWRAPVKE